MASDDIRAELEQIRAQLEALQRAEEEGAGPARDGGGANGPAEADGRTQEEAAGAEQEGGSELLNQFRELLDSLDEELQESHPTTLLAVFTLGILVGRLLPR